MKDTIDTIFHNWFKVRLLHSDYATPWENFLSKAISITPDTATKQFLQNHSATYRFDGNLLNCFIRCASVNPPAAQPKQPVVEVADDTHLRFLVYSSNDFFLKTWVTSAGSKKLYQFSNQVNNSNATDHFITNAVEAHVAAKDYEPGTVVSSGGNLYATLKPVLAADSIGINNTTYWKLLKPLEQVVSNADLADPATVKAEENCFGVIDIYKTGTAPGYQLFDASGNLLDPPPVFTVRFSSRF